MPCPPPGDLPNLGIEPRSPTLQADSLPSEPPGKLISSRVRLKPRSALLTLVPTVKNFRPWQAGGQMILIWLIFWLLSLFAGCHPLLLNQTYFQLDLNQGYTNKEIDIDYELRILRINILFFKFYFFYLAASGFSCSI